MTGKLLATNGRIKIGVDKGWLRLQFPSALSRQLYGRRQFFKGLGRKDDPESRHWAERIAARIQADIDHPDSEQLFDPTFVKYFDVKISTNFISLPVVNNALKLQDFWLEFVEYKLRIGAISETTYKTRHNGMFARWLKPYMDESLSYELAEKILFDLLQSGVNKENLKKLILALKQAGDRAVNQGHISRNFFANLAENIKPAKRSNQLIQEEEYKAYSLAERNIIIEAFQKSSIASERRIAALVEFLFLTGCRLGEAFALKWHNIKADWIVFDESYSSETKITKSTKTNTIRLFRTKGYQRLNELINRLKAKGYQENDYVFTTINDKQYDRYKLSASWLGIDRSKGDVKHYQPGVITRLVQSQKIDQYLKPSATRHTFITIQANNGTDLKLLADSVGNSVDIIYSHYLGVSRDATLVDI